MDDNIAEMLQKALDVYNFPIILVLGDISGSELIVINLIQGIKDVDQLLIELMNAYDQYELLLQSAPAAPLSSHQLLMQEQNREYEESLKKDQEIELMKEMQRIQEEQDETRKKEEEEIAEKERIANQQQIARNLPEEPPESQKTGVTKLNIRLPNGKRLERRFNETDTLEVRICN